MGSASKLLVPLATPTPSPFRLTRRSDNPLAALSLSYGRRLLSLTQRAKLRFSVRDAAAQAHTEVGGVRGFADGEAPLPLPSSSIADTCPEWERFLDFVSARGCYNRDAAAIDDDDDNDSLLDGEHLAEEFVKAAEACLLFARDRPDLLRSLEKKDIQIIAENGSPFLFKNGSNSARRLRSFCSDHGDNVPETDSAKTIDLMRYLLSYSCISYSSKHDEHLKVREHIEVPIRNLLVELVKETTAVEKLRLDESTTKPTTSRQQPSRPPGQNFEMKRGDWICQKCSFLNFARNMRCLECNDTRPKRVLTGGEWECPQCDFYNYGRNTSCLRCDCKCPTEVPPSLATSGVGVSCDKSSTVQADSFRSSGLSGMEPNAVPTSSISKRLDSIIGRSSTTSGLRRRLVSSERDNGTGISSEQSERIPTQRRDPDYVPFVPLPSDMFSNPQKSSIGLRQSSLEQYSTSPMGTDRMSDRTVKKSESMVDSNDKDSSEAEKWSKKVAELNGASDLVNSVSDDDFPEIMPMRKGENRFVISKKKDRSLTSPQYKRRIALEQASSSHYVPFVPFPPGYFAKKDTQPESSTKDSPSGGLMTNEKAMTVPEKSVESMTETSNLVSSGNVTLLAETKATSQSNNSSANSSGEIIKGSKVGFVYDIAGTTSVGSPGWTNSNENGNNEHSSITHGVEDANAKGQQSESSQSAEGRKTSLGGNSLEGSLVKEPDPLDMSEEAKAARWFRRVAQIKDISELSNIPDEDFPEIMPMRKGVNRFVVSKRKTPLERRLASSRYTKNLPVINSNPDKDAS